MIFKRHRGMLIHSRYFEMAYNKSKFQNIVANHIDQIVQNWCLMDYCLRYRKDLSGTYEHWRTELETQMDIIARKVVKGDKRSWIHQVVVGWEELNRKERVLSTCKLKFKRENENGLNITKEQQEAVCLDCSVEIEDIIDGMMIEDVSVYVSKRFPKTK